MLYTHTHTHTHWNTSHRKEQILPFVITWMDLKVKFAQSCPTLWDSMENSPGWNTGGSSFSLSRGSSQPRDRTGVSCIAGGFFTNTVPERAAINVLAQEPPWLTPGISLWSCVAWCDPFPWELWATNHPSNDSCVLICPSHPTWIRIELTF